ncbi:hypothetical protein DN745_07735 [Bradymonas sediminis]|uniref:DUF1795 domain-containing protein n=1 Tax=Bradymonas sediminis TaxID=1548548 RepID=A0A2Z4FJR0_9DELT|nr:hypothetical protein DN745_07735 [Bradymonas sediminis]
MFGSLNCKSDPVDPDSLPAWTFQSPTAPYSVEVPGQWAQTPVEEINRFADLALRVEDQYFLIIIPQKLPQYEGVASPDALDLKRASVGVLKERVTEFNVEREGPLELNGQPALSVFASGVHEGDPVKYINTYTTHDSWGFQIIAWGPASNENGLVEATDKLLAGLQFKGVSAADGVEPGAQESADSE